MQRFSIIVALAGSVTFASADTLDQLPHGWQYAIIGTLTTGFTAAMSLVVWFVKRSLGRIEASIERHEQSSIDHAKLIVAGQGMLLEVKRDLDSYRASEDRRLAALVTTSDMRGWLEGINTKLGVLGDRVTKIETRCEVVHSSFAREKDDK